MSRRNIIKILEANKGSRGGKYVTTKSGRKVYIKDNGSTYIKINKPEDDNSTSKRNND